MRNFLKSLVLLLIGSVVIMVVVILIIILVIDRGGTNVHDLEHINRQALGFLDQASFGLPEGERFALVGTDGPVENWVLLTVARTNPDLGEKTGASGLIAIGHLENGAWVFRVQGEDATFDRWLSEIPEELLSKELRDYFLTYNQDPSASLIPPGKPRSIDRTQEITLNLPYPEKKSYKISTLPGEYYHKGSMEYAIDFDMPEGSALAAVTNGSLMDFKDDSKFGGCDPKYADDANFIRIKIAPDRAVLYLHIQAGSILAKVKAEKKVAVGQIIARSGSTGFTCNWLGTGPGPHLHIVLEKLCGNRVCGSLPLNFVEFGPGDPKHGKDYVSQNKSPEKRLAEAEEQRREQEQKEIDEIKKVAGKYASIWGCGVEEGCEISSHPDRQLATANLIKQMEDWVPVIGGKARKADPIDWEVLSTKIVGEGIAEVEGKLFADVITASGVHQYEYMHIFIKIVKIKGTWKIDERIKRCGYLTDTEGNRFSAGVFSLPYCEY